jgi:hypothetical protein
MLSYEEEQEEHSEMHNVGRRISVAAEKSANNAGVGDRFPTAPLVMVRRGEGRFPSQCLHFVLWWWDARQ